MVEKISAEDVLTFLEHNQGFTETYFVQRATPAMVEKWYEEQNKKIRLLNKNRPPKDALYKFAMSPVNVSICEEEEPEKTSPPGTVGYQRRYSEPPASIAKDSQVSVQDTAPSPSYRDRKRATLTQTKAIKSFDVKENNDVTYTRSKLFFGGREEFASIKPALRKAQSLPVYKNTLTQLINSTVYTTLPQPTNWTSKVDPINSGKTESLLKALSIINHDLGLKSLYYKILINLGLLTGATLCSLYLVKFKDKKQFLAPYIIDLNVHQSGSEEDRNSCKKDQWITMGKGILGSVAASGHTVCCKTPTESCFYDGETDYHCKAENNGILCQSLPGKDNQVIGVVLLRGKTSGETFTEDDCQVGRNFLSFAGICLENANIFEVSRQEFNRNKALLELAYDIFEEQTTLSKLVQKMMKKAVDLFRCKECSVMLMSDPKHSNLFSEEGSSFSHIFHLSSSGVEKGLTYSSLQRDSMDLMSDPGPFSDYVADYVAVSGKVFNSSRTKNCVATQSGKHNNNNEEYANTHDYLICMPLRNNVSEIIGVVKLMGRTDDGRYDEKDEKMLEAFSIFCGLGINNCILYSKVCRAKAHQKVALEVLSYHTSARQLEVERLRLSPIPTALALNIRELTFDDFSLGDDQMLTAGIRMFIEFGFIKRFHIPYTILCRFLLTVRRNYRNVIYHNWRHAFNVAQSMFSVLTSGKMSECLSSTESLALLVGCLCHDLDHRGLNNEFQTKTESNLAKLYGTSTMEHHHFNHAVMILNSEDNNIFQNLTSEEYSNVMKYLKHSILATDLAKYLKYREIFVPMVKEESYNFNKLEHRGLLRGMLMTACDLNGITKPWEVQKKVVHLVTSEFFHQGDIERDTLQMEPKALMDRNNILQLPKMQVQFFDTIGIPVYKLLAEINPNLQPLAEGAISNRNRWLTLSQQVEEGHIDPDLKPLLEPVKTPDTFYV